MKNNANRLVPESNSYSLKYPAILKSVGIFEPSLLTFAPPYQFATLYRKLNGFGEFIVYALYRKANENTGAGNAMLS